MDTDSANDTFLWSLTEIENDCSLCLRQIGISNNIPGVVLPCCQQVVCEDCYKDELMNKNNGSCPFCFFKGNGKNQKPSISINNNGISMNGVMNTVNPAITSTGIPNGHNTNANCLSSVSSGLPLDLSCWLPQNLTAICNPGYQSNSSSTCATSPYYKSNSTTAGEGFNQDNFIYMRGSTIPGVVCGQNHINNAVCTPNINIQNSHQPPFGVLNDGFWNNHSAIAIQNNTVNHNTTGSSTNGSFISDPWMSTSSGYSPSNGFLHDFNSYDNNINNSINPNIGCSNTESITDTSTNISHIKQCNNGASSLINNGHNPKVVNGTINGHNESRNSIIDNDKACDLINDTSKDSLYQTNINVSSFNQTTPNVVSITGSNTSDIYQNNSIYTWTVQNPMSCNNINSFNQVNNHNVISSATSVDVDFQRFCLGLGFDINSQNQVASDSQQNILIGDHINNSNTTDRNNKVATNGVAVNNHQNVKPSEKSDDIPIKEVESDSIESDIRESYVNNSSPAENKPESKEPPICPNLDNSIVAVDEGCGSGNINNPIIESSSNTQLFNNSAFPPLTSALIKQIPSSKDSAKMSNNTLGTCSSGTNTGSSQHNECLSSSNSPKLSNISVSSSNQNINNNNPSTGSNPKLISMMGVRTEGSIRNNSNIGSALSTNNSKQNTNNSSKATSTGGLNISAGNVSYMDAVLHKNDNNVGTTTTSNSGRSENQAPISTDVSNANSDNSNNIAHANTDEDSAPTIGTHGEPYNYKRALCRHWMRGYCWLEADCKFAHGEAELRTRDGKLRHPTLSIGSSETTNQNQSSTQPPSQYTSTTQISTVNVTVPPGNLTAASTSFATSTNGGSTISSSVQAKGLKQQSGGSKTGNSASYAATAASSLTNTVLNNDPNISYSVMVVSGASNMDSKR
ncbi:hypothetical protein OIY81_360 [Cryptosporidium canis]|uniref:Uncharacterized protein n=1 Tax=Cryptosporidium canis TaxID=195482 RepID=A0ABQ8P6X1_9CRYT|nr:hypothetical protein OJ252_2886 [Cryptosporidium canis]KAJ1614658.1 hypothetical protein OIY81_360 [Cryptosporidium canis]